MLVPFGPCSVSTPVPPWTMTLTGRRRRGEIERVISGEAVEVQGGQRRNTGQIVHVERVVAANAVHRQRLDGADVESEKTDIRTVEAKAGRVWRNQKDIRIGDVAVDLHRIGVSAALVDVRPIAVAPNQHIVSGFSGLRIGARTAGDPIVPGAAGDHVCGEAAD